MSRLSECQDSLKTCRAKVTDLQDQITQKDARIQNLQTQLDGAQAEVTSLKADVAQLTSKNQAQDAEITALNAQVVKLQADLKACQDAANPPEPPAGDFEQVPVGANLQTVLRDAGPGAKLQLPATLKFSSTVVPLAGQYLRGPCAITPTSSSIGLGFNCSTAQIEDVTFEKLDVSGFAKRGMQPYFGNTIKASRVHHNGEMGVGFDGNGRDGTVFTMIDCETDHNGDPSFLGHGASGVKLFHVKRSKFVRLKTHDNIGNGLWWDAECGYAEVLGGEAFGNNRKAYFWEKSGGNHGTENSQPYDGMLTIDGVNAHDNNLDGGTGHAGVYIVASKNFVVKNSTFGGNDGWGITVRNDQDRITGDQHRDHPGWVTSNGEISDSTNTMNGDKVTIGPDVTGVRRT